MLHKLASPRRSKVFTYSHTASELREECANKKSFCAIQLEVLIRISSGMVLLSSAEKFLVLSHASTPQACLSGIDIRFERICSYWCEFVGISDQRRTFFVQSDTFHAFQKVLVYNSCFSYPYRLADHLWA